MDDARPLGVGGPVIENLNAKIGTLERRLDYLQRRAASHDPNRKDTTREYDAQEASALRAALAALRYHRSSLGEEDVASVVLAEVIDALEERAAARTPAEREASTARVEDVRRRARVFLDDLD